MKITINLDTQAVITQPTPIRVKAASYVAVEISFTRSSQAMRLPEGATIEFALKPLGQFTGDLLAYDNNFALAAGFNYTGTVNLSSQPLLAALGLGDSDPSNDDAQIKGSGEITWSVGSQKFRSGTFPVVVEAPLTDDNPVATPDPVLYPPPSEVVREIDLVAHTSDTNNPHAVTKAQVGLGNADNTSDAEKPISTAVGAALAAKANASDLTNLSIPLANISDATPLGRALITATEDAATALDGSETIPAQQGGGIRQLAVPTLAGYIGSVIGATGSNRIVVTDRFSLANLPTPDANGNQITEVHVGDVVYQTGTPAVSRTAVMQFVDHPITDDDVNNGYGIRFFDENGTEAQVQFDWFGGSGGAASAADLANAFANQVNCSGLNAYANVTGDGTQVTVTSYTSGPLAGAWSFQDDSNGASMTVTEGTSNLPPGDFIVADLSNLGNASGYQGIGDTVDFLSGYGAPTADIGEEGNGYVDQNNGDFYHRDANGWSFVLNIKGPQGDQGPQGNQGNQGPSGATGPDGPQGKPGGMISEAFAKTLIETWTSSSISSNLGPVIWAAEIGIFLAASPGSSFYTSPDGITWTARSLPFSSSPWKAVVWSPETGLFVALGYNVNNYITSPDGITWTSRPLPVDSSFQNVVWSPDLGYFVLLTYAHAYISSDGIAWTQKTVNGSIGYSNCRWVPELGAFYGICGNNPSITMSVSPDGWTWMSYPMPSPGNQSWMTLAWSPELKLFATSSACSTNYTAVSPDGINWTMKQGLPSNSGYWNYLIWISELSCFVVLPIFAGNNILYSYDGLNWIPVTPVTSGSATYSGLAWSPELGIALAVNGGDHVMRSKWPKKWSTNGAFYTPVETDAANISAKTVSRCRWSRQGRVVYVQGSIVITPTTANALTQFKLSLPVPSTFAATTDLSGTFAGPSASHGGSITADTSGMTAAFNFTPPDTTAQTLAFALSYAVQPF